MSVEKICWPAEQVIVWIGTFIWLVLLCSFLYLLYGHTTFNFHAFEHSIW